MRIRLKSPHGNAIVSLSETSETVETVFRDVIAPNNAQLFKDQTVVAIKSGFPPKPIDLNAKLGDVIQNGDQLILELGGQTAAHPTTPQSKQKKVATDTEQLVNKLEIPSISIPDIDQYLILRNIPDDNSCMFNAIAYALGKPFDYSQDLRLVVSNEISRDPITYNEIILGRSNDNYCSWISKKDSWGGAIELGILLKTLNLRINCIDIELGNFIKFEDESSNPTNFINLIYSGVHYDLLVTNPTLSVDRKDKASDLGKWSIDFEPVINQYSNKLVKLLQLRNYTTNTTTFRVRCLQCYQVLVGETGASKHANDTGHYNFGEVDK